MARPRRSRHGAGAGGLTILVSVGPKRILLVFVDGVGLGPAVPENPLARAQLTTLGGLLGGARPVIEEVGVEGIDLPDVRLAGLDANLGVEGRPQSGTGQTALLTGVNAPSLMGRHFGPWVPTALRGLLQEKNLFRTAREAGHAVAFANAYPMGFFETGGRGARWPGAIPLAAHLAGALLRDERSIRAAGALPSSITSEAWRRYVDPDAPILTAEDAGAILANLANTHDLTIFAHFDTDNAGHGGDLREGIAAIERVDALLAGVLRNLDDDVLLLLTSDHGNLEDTTTGHTRNPVPLLAAGPGAVRLTRSARTTMDVAPLILGALAG